MIDSAFENMTHKMCHRRENSGLRPLHDQKLLHAFIVCYEFVILLLPKIRNRSVTIRSHLVIKVLAPLAD